MPPRWGLAQRTWGALGAVLEVGFRGGRAKAWVAGGATQRPPGEALCPCARADMWAAWGLLGLPVLPP